MVWLAYGWSTELVLFAPTESISSMKITHGALSFAASANKMKTSHYKCKLLLILTDVTLIVLPAITYRDVETP
jgi:hypothetical protein